MFTRTLDVILALQNFTDVTHKGGKRTEVSIMCCGNGWRGFVPILIGKVFAQIKGKDNKKKQRWLYLRFTFYLYKKKNTSSCRNNVN